MSLRSSPGRRPGVIDRSVAASGTEGGIRRVVPPPDDAIGEPSAFFGLDRPQFLQLLPVGAGLLGEGIQHL